MRTQAEIISRFNQSVDLFTTQKNDLAEYLTYQSAKELNILKPEVTEAEWKVLENSKQALEDVIKDYLPFAWDKANNGRGLSAARSLLHFKSWLWLYAAFFVGVDRERIILLEMDLEDYVDYGKPQLQAIGELVGYVHDNN